MFGINFSEIALILLISLVVFGPKQLPQIASQLGRLIFAIRHYIERIKQDLYQQSGFNEINKAKTDLIKTYQQLKKDIVINNPIIEDKINNYMHEEELYQPELDFSNQPELF